MGNMKKSILECISAIIILSKSTEEYFKIPFTKSPLFAIIIGNKSLSQP